MTSKMTDYLTPARDYSRELARRGEQWSRRAPAPVRESPGGSLVGVAALALVVAAGIYYGPDLIRYLKIRRM